MIVSLDRVMLEIPMMIVVVVGVRGDGELMIRRGGGQMDRRRRRSLLLLDAQVSDGGDGGDVGGTAMLLMLMMVMHRDADGGSGRFRAAGTVLNGSAHRANDQRRFNFAFRSIVSTAHQTTADRA